jgi:uncharacterized protein with LGFP repeats
MGDKDTVLLSDHCSRCAAIERTSRKWQQLGGVAGELGASLGPAEQVPWTNGYYARYERGRIFWRPGERPCVLLFAHPIHDYWVGLGGANGPLGFPTSDEHTNSDGSIEQYFEHGLIHWEPARGTTTHVTRHDPGAHAHTSTRSSDNPSGQAVNAA